MTAFSVELKQYLQGQTAAGQQVYNDHAPQGSLPPYIEVVQTSGGEDYIHLRGSAPVVEETWQIYAYGITRGTTDDLGEECRQLLQAFTGNMGATFVHDVMRETSDGGTDLNQSKDYSPRYWHRGVYSVNHSIAEVSF